MEEENLSGGTKVNHVAIVVNDIDQALFFWRDLLGLPLNRVEEVPEQHATVAFLPAGGSEIELVKPVGDDSGLARYLQKHGPGMHHICFEVEDLPALLSSLKKNGIKLINETPVELDGGKRIAFIHPRDANGVLVELFEL